MNICREDQDSWWRLWGYIHDRFIENYVTKNKDNNSMYNKILCSKVKVEYVTWPSHNQYLYSCNKVNYEYCSNLNYN